MTIVSDDQTLSAIGLMSGTSLDGIDVARIYTNGSDYVKQGEGMTYPYPDAVTEALLSLLEKPEQAFSLPLSELEEAVTDAQTQAVRQFLEQFHISLQDVDVVGFHGQTVLHRPEQKFTRQLGLGQRMACDLKIPVVSQFRLADVKAGGEGAPLVPVFHQALASELEKPVVILNLGGVGNVTYLDEGIIIAFDTGPAGALIDDYMRRHFNCSYDEGGMLAAQGKPNPALLSSFLTDSFFSRKPPKSLDRNAFHRWNSSIEALSPEDAVATLTAYTVESVAASCHHMPHQAKLWLVGGGGRENSFIMERLQDRLNVPVLPVESVGWNGDFLEAQAFGYLAVRHIRNLPLTYPGTTGVATPLCGGVMNIPLLCQET